MSSSSSSSSSSSFSSSLARNERHPQRSHKGRPVRGGDTKKGGRGGKGTWLGDGSDAAMRHGALDRRDPNYCSSSSSSSEDEATPQRQHQHQHQHQHQQQLQQRDVPLSQSESAPTAGGFKRIELGQLFGGYVGQMPNGSPSSASSSSSSTATKEQYAGGAHHNIPEASTLPLPASLSNTPQKARASSSAVVSSPDTLSARQIEQSLKAMLRIDGA